MLGKLRKKLHAGFIGDNADQAVDTNPAQPTRPAQPNTGDYTTMAIVGAALRGKLVLITGCTGGIGQASAKAFARQGCSIAVHYNASSSLEKAKTLISELQVLAGPSARFGAFQADLSTYDAVRKLHAEVVQSLGNPDVLFANHGIAGPKIGPTGDIKDVDVDVFEQVWRTNTGTSYLLAQLCVPYMEQQKWGRVIFTSSIAAGNGGVIGPHYSSSKSALHGIVHWLSLRYAKEDITSNAIAPALIEGTAMMANPTPEMRSKIPLGRLGKPDEIAELVLLLANNAYMTNKIIVADGGWTHGNF